MLDNFIAVCHFFFSIELKADIAILKSFFDNTVDLLIYLGDKTGLGYTGINVLILIVVLLIIFISVGLNIYLLKKTK